MKRLAGMLLIGVLAALILQPVCPRVNSPFNNQPTRADGVPIPPKPPTLVAQFPIPPKPPTLVAQFPIPPKPPMLIADNWPIPPIPPQKLVSGAVWVA